MITDFVLVQYEDGSSKSYTVDEYIRLPIGSLANTHVRFCDEATYQKHRRSAKHETNDLDPSRES